MNKPLTILGWFAGFCLALALVSPGVVGADDVGVQHLAFVQSDDDDDVEPPAPFQADDDDDDVPPADDDDDDDVEPPAPFQADDDDDDVPPADDDDDDVPPAPVPSDDDDDDFGGDDDDDLGGDDDDDLGGDDDDDLGGDDDDDFGGDDDDDVGGDEQSAPLPVDDDDDDDDVDETLDAPRQDQAMVKLRDGVDPEAFAGRHNVSVLRVIPTPNIVLLGLDPNLDDDLELVNFLADDDAEWAEPNYTAQAPEGRPRYFFSAVAGVPQIVDGPALSAGLEFTPEASCVTGAEVIVAVLDTGVDVDHPALAANLLPNGVNMVDNTWDVRDIGNDLDDDDDGQIDEMVGHGTHVTGIVLQVAPDAQILPVKVLNSDGVGDDFTVTSGIHYAVEQGADVINLSLGSTYDSLAVRDAVDFAVSQGVVVVAAAGNGDRQLPADYPAATDMAISVAATTDEADKASYSNFHETVDISAPGSDAASAYPGGLYVTASGTSMSAPLVAGSAALILERQPNATPETVATVLQQTSGPLNLSDPALEGLLGAGEIDIDASISCAG